MVSAGDIIGILVNVESLEMSFYKNCQLQCKIKIPKHDKYWIFATVDLHTDTLLFDRQIWKHK